MKNIFLKNTNLWIRENIKSIRILHVMGVLLSIYILVYLYLCVTNPSYRPFSIGLPAPLKVFNAEQAGFSMEYPKTWSAGETSQGSHGDMEIIASIARFGRSFPHVSIARLQFQKDDAIYDVVEWGQTRAKRDTSYMFMAQEELESENYQGVLVEYALKRDTLTSSVVRHCEDWYTLIGSMGYALSFCVNEQDWTTAQEVFKEMIQSFMIVKN